MGKKVKESSWRDKYSFVEELGTGGNAKVSKVKDENDNFYALKELKSKSDPEKVLRFQEEIKVMTENQDIPGIVPIIEACPEECWYVMPVALPAMSRLSVRKGCIKEIRKAITQLTETLKMLQARNIAHRDIKPDNLYFFNERYCFGDFGLVDFPNHIDGLTNSRRNLGAKFTIAPEMMRYPKDADGLKADIYSLAKTFWMFFTGDSRGFEGRYNYLDRSHGLRFREGLRNQHIVEIEQLINQSTSNEPEDRPSIDEFYNSILKWNEVSAEVNKSQESDWQFIEKLIFGDFIPQSTTWSNIRVIKNVLEIVTSSPAYNHMLFPDNGGLDLKKIEYASEEGWIDLVTELDLVYRVKPKMLFFEGFGENIGWNYFRLELEETSSILPEKTRDIFSEKLVEDYPAHYVDAADACYGVYDYDTGEPLPEGAKILTRYTGGVFLIVMKYGLYNAISATYDGRHGDCDNINFRKYIEQLVKAEKEAKKRGLNPRDVLNRKDFSRNPFKYDRGYDSVYGYRVAQRQNTQEFIDENILKWQFPICKMTKVDKESVRIIYYYTLRNSACRIIDLKKGQEDVLCSDGYIRNITPERFEECVQVASKDEAHHMNAQFDDFVLTQFTAAGIEALEGEESLFVVKIKRGNLPPIHLFTKEEIKLEMQKADDRLGNVLVIDEEGVAHVIPNNDEVNYYPVRTKSWLARNNYVGKYSSLDDLDSAYLRVLDGWRRYLHKGEQVLADYTDLTDDSECIKEIEKYYAVYS